MCVTDQYLQLPEWLVRTRATAAADCQHIVLATINKADVLASWNFKHILNLERIRGCNSINFREGYQMTEIRTPNEIFRDEDGN